eukprot:m.64967 g.64967  ORF g.64967 m.64967 type:complete len:538 (+) comp7298_c0_seq2:64-1677(+)
MALKARALYDFQGDSSLNELSFKTGDEIIVIRQDIGEGWWEGQIGHTVGLFPQSYVELNNENGGDSDDWDEDEEDWDDGDKPQAAAASASAASASAAHHQDHAASESHEYYGGGGGGGAYQGGSTIGRATLKRSVYRFSGFVKAGAESYMIGGLKELTIDPTKMIHMNPTSEGLQWVPNPQPYGAVGVSHAGKRSKFKGMKSFDAYTISCGEQGSVERRHKHFVWLWERLHDKYSCVCVPPLPDKQFFGKFSEDEVTKRQQKLQQWLIRVCRHPVLSRDKLSLHHFLTHPSSDEKGWKIGKRAAEKDDFVGGQFFKLINQDAPCPKNSDKEIETFATVIKDTAAVVRKNQEIALQHADRMYSGFRREYKRISEGLKELGETFAQASQSNGDSVKLSMALVLCGKTYDDIATMWATQPVNDQIPLYEGLKEYGGLLNQFSDAISSSREASQKVTEIELTAETAKEEERASKTKEKDIVRARRDIIHSLALCEVAHFHKQRREDFRDMMKAYLKAQIEFHERVAEKLRQAKAEFDKLQY